MFRVWSCVFDEFSFLFIVESARSDFVFDFVVVVDDFGYYCVVGFVVDKVVFVGVVELA